MACTANPFLSRLCSLVGSLLPLQSSSESSSISPPARRSSLAAHLQPPPLLPWRPCELPSRPIPSRCPSKCLPQARPWWLLVSPSLPPHLLMSSTTAHMDRHRRASALSLLVPWSFHPWLVLHHPSLLYSSSRSSFSCPWRCISNGVFPSR
jgi:hypothetical protein